MRAWQVVQNFGIDNLRAIEIPQSPLTSHEVRVKIHACSLNYRDLMVIKGLYNPHQQLPFVPLSDGAGEVTEVGADVKSLKVGDRVCATFSQKWQSGTSSTEAMQHTLGSPLDGMLMESRVFFEEGLIKFPDYLTYEEAATLPCAAVTAFNAIAYQGNLKPEDVVLLEGTGGVSLFALQFAKTLGMKTIITSSSDDKLAKAKALGADFTINYKDDAEWQLAVLERTRGEGVDAVIEVGGKSTIGRAIASVRKGGVVCVIGILTGISEALDLRPILMNNIRLQGLFVGPKTIFEAMNRVLLHNKIHPVVDRVFPFSEAPAALTYLESAQHFGKVCIKMA